MPQKSNDTRVQTKLLLDAFLESLVGVFALRIPDVQATIRGQAPTMSVESSYDGQHLILEAAVIVGECKVTGQEIQTTITQIARVFAAAMWDSLLSHSRYDSIATPVLPALAERLRAHRQLELPGTQAPCTMARQAAHA